MTTEHQFLTTAQLLEQAGIKRRTLFDHILKNTCGIRTALEKSDGAGRRFNAKKAAKYIAWMQARKPRPSS